MFSCCQSKPDIENVLEKDMDNLRIRVEEMRKQKNNIYELLEALTNESKNKYNLNESNSNVSEKTDEQRTAKTYFLDKKSV